jgi:hypothetical protein
MKTRVIITFTALAIVLIAAWWAYAQVTAIHTGRVKHVRTVSGKFVLDCEYRYGQRFFWKLFDRSACPSSVTLY